MLQYYTRIAALENVERVNLAKFQQKKKKPFEITKKWLWIWEDQTNRVKLYILKLKEKYVTWLGKRNILMDNKMLFGH